MKKIPAFTLMELMIGMILSSLVMGLCYSGYLFISKQYADYQDRKSELNEVLQLHTVMSADVRNAEAVTFSEGILVLKGDSAAVRYEFMDSVLVRSMNEATDTFHVLAENITRLPLNENDSSGLLTEFSFKAMLFEEPHIVRCSKEYDAATFMNEKTEQTWP